MATVLPGSAYPLGATFDGAGVNFALYSRHAEGASLCLFDKTGQQETARLPLKECSAGVWHGYLPGATPGLIYGYRVHGPYAPQHGHRFNPAKLLLDPYARSVIGTFQDDPLHNGFCAHAPHQADPHDNAAQALKAQVVHEPFDWGADASPQVPWARSVIYEAHVKGFTRQHPEVPKALQGTYAGLAHPSVIKYLQQLGITALELMPVQCFLDEVRLQRMNLNNYWGYNPIAWFAPEPRYWSGQAGTTPLSEFRQMVKALHAAGIEVILDVVFNHSAETDGDGPTLSLRGIDNASYYTLNPGNLAQYENSTGCGNALNLEQPCVVQLVMDCLRYWVSECHVDGFRFDLAVTLGRDPHGFNPEAALFAAIQQDPLLASCKLLAEPWDVGAGGYQLGHFPVRWTEWNDQFRDVLRRFWLHDGVSRALFARRFAASSDCFHQPGRAPTTALNFLSAHDGFTLADLVSYNHKHNLANGEHNHDGHSHNLSWNCGVEGPSDDPHVRLLRLRVRKAMLATLLLAQGTPMLLGGDELGHSQQGNNNAYCQDNAISWLDWSAAELALTQFVAKLLTIRRAIPALNSGRWWTGQPDETGVRDVEWLNPAATPLAQHDWEDPAGKALMIRLSGAWLLLVNASGHQLHFHLPPGRWTLRLSSAEDGMPVPGDFTASARSVAVLMQE